MLPKSIFTIHLIKQPSTRKIVDGVETYKELKFRPYVVKEEKILMHAKESGEIKDIYTAVKQIITACCEEEIDVEKLPTFDLEYMFLRLRSASVSNIETIQITHGDREYSGELDFEKIEVTFPEKDISNVIEISPDVNLVMKYPTASVYDESNEGILKKLKNKDMFDFVVNCIDKVYNGDILLPMSNDELKEFLDGVGIPVYKKMKDFLVKMPKIIHKVYYTTATGEERFIQLSSLLDFFPFL